MMVEQPMTFARTMAPDPDRQVESTKSDEIMTCCDVFIGIGTGVWGRRGDGFGCTGDVDCSGNGQLYFVPHCGGKRRPVSRDDIAHGPWDHNPPPKIVFDADLEPWWYRLWCQNSH